VRFRALVSGRYKLRILWELRSGAARYSAIQRALVDASGGARITPRVLSRDLKELGANGLVTRRQFPTVPPRVEYALTPEGRALLGVMRAICRWGERQPGPAEKVADAASAPAVRVRSDRRVRSGRS
jgi:DNA-binding HxlR family transcriptional regulator